MQLNETDLLHIFIERAPHTIPGIHVERRNIINERSARGHWLKNGVIGQADAFAIYRGVHVELETKAARGAMADAQKCWRIRCLNPPMGGPSLCPHLVLKAGKAELPEQTVTRWIEELSQAIRP